MTILTVMILIAASFNTNAQINPSPEQQVCLDQYANSTLPQVQRVAEMQACMQAYHDSLQATIPQAEPVSTLEQEGNHYLTLLGAFEDIETWFESFWILT